MKPIKNSFFKWIFHLNAERQRVIQAFRKEGETAENIVVNTYSKYKSWWKKEKVEEKDFDRHRKSILKRFFDNNQDTTTAEIHKLKSNLTNFITINEAENNPLLEQKILFGAAKRLNFQEAYFYHLQKRETLNINTKKQGAKYFLECFEVNYNRYFHPAFEKDKVKIELNNTTYFPEETIQQTWSNLQMFTLTAQMKLACELQVRKVNYADKFIDSIKKDIDTAKQQIENYPFEVCKAAHIYKEIFDWLQFDNLENIAAFDKTKDKILDNIEIFPEKEQATILILLLNYGSVLYTKNPVESSRIYHECSEFGFKNNIWAKETAMESSLFMNMFDLTYKNHLDFARKLHTVYIDKINETERQWVKDFINARLLFLEKGKKYIDALNLVKNLENHRNYGFTLRRHIVILQCQYEIEKALENNVIKWSRKTANLCDDVAMEQTVTNFKKCIYTTQYFDQPSDQIKNAALNFITALFMIKNKTVSTDEVKKYLETNSTYAKDWLYEII